MPSVRGQRVLVRAVERWLEIISEAIRYIPTAEKERHAIDWKQVSGIGNILRHGHQVIDRRVLWNLVAQDLPPLRVAIEAIYVALKLPTDPWPDAQ